MIFTCVTCVFTWQLKGRDLNIPNFTEQYLVDLDLRVKILKKPYCGAEIKNFYERPCLHFHPVGILSFLADEPDSRHIYNFVKLFEVQFE